MKYVIFLASVALLQGCSLYPKYQTPFSVEDPSIKGENSFADGAMISSTKTRYWLSYRYALEKGGYTVVDGTFPYFKVSGFNGPTENKDANYQFWKDGQVYAQSLCSDFFRRVSLTKAHRDHAKKETNIIGGIVTAGMGLAGSASAAVGGAGLLFSGAETSFDAYDSSYLVTPDLGLMEALVRAVQDKLRKSVNKNDLAHVSDSISRLNEYVYPCTFTGMQALLDNALNKKASAFSYSPFSQEDSESIKAPSK